MRIGCPEIVLPKVDVRQGRWLADPDMQSSSGHRNYGGEEGEYDDEEGPEPGSKAASAAAVVCCNILLSI